MAGSHNGGRGIWLRYFRTMQAGTTSGWMTIGRNIIGFSLGTGWIDYSGGFEVVGVLFCN